MPESSFDRVVIAPVEAMVASAPGPPDVSARAAFDTLEAALTSLKGRTFYGFFDPSAGRYHACVAMQDRDDPETLGLTRMRLPGGAYLRARLRGEPPELYARIGPTFDALQAAAGAARDASRLFLEAYRRRDEVDVLVPVADRPGSRI